MERMKLESLSRSWTIFDNFYNIAKTFRSVISNLKFSNFSFFPTALHELHVSHKTELIAIETIKYSFFFKYDNFPVHLMCDPGKSCTLIRNSKKSIPDESECFASFIVLSILTLVKIQTNFEQVLVSKSR